jgi:hypothetical protein
MKAPDPYDEHWHQLVTAALLGTDRRDPPPPPPGPLADLVADTVRETPSQRMLADVAASAALRRAGFVPGPSAVRLVEAPFIDRPSCPVEAVATWRYLVAEWPVLEDEWVLAVVEHGWQLPPDVVVALLSKHRGDAVRRARVALAARPLAGWLTEHVPELAAHGPAGRSGAVDADQVTTLPPLPIPPELAELAHVDAHTFCRRLLAEVAAGRMGRAERAVLVNLLARCRPDVLEPAADALAEVDPGSPSAAEAWALADLATTRGRMLDELARPAGTPSR